MQKIVQNVSQVSFFFFLVFGILHISLSILIAQGIAPRLPWLFFNILDLPFLLSGLLYGSTRLSLSLENITGNIKTPLMICGGISIVLFLIALYFNFLIPDVPFR
ncbi:hypothetical protein HOD30_04575 [Candidatus Peregrinibacteria bacterium]|nr:hypothetical protein [Candidatus Peregrinibacteria bacterium]MBT4632190.1 hypothetical protein [Candidatus Peregrinibacteria bacterium]MBT5516540.1 hypothetical protein [Candidatus Peregrinibacteria bacterium]MBT5824143.1 hypothetical protein [Candidatus Peregrinibacteria bacterium]